MENTIIRDLLSTDRVLKTCRAISLSIAKYDHCIADDISQQAFLELLEEEVDYQDKIDGPDDLYTEFSRLTVNAYNRLIYSMRNLHIEISEDIASVDIDVSDIEIESIISQISDSRLKTVVEMLYSGYRVSDIADTLKCTARNVHKLKHKARRCLECIV